jgi:hypothetical protein
MIYAYIYHDMHTYIDNPRKDAIRSKTLCVSDRLGWRALRCATGVTEQFYFSPLSLEPLGGEWAIEYEEVCVFHTTFLAAFLVPSRVLIRSVMQGVHQRLWAAVMGCSIDIRPQLLKNVLLAGGNTLFDGLPEMLFKKLKALSTG